jgi:cytochrome b6-f complex iron-sulfur subunit
MATEKLSTAEILALARRQGASGAEGGSSPEAAAAEPAAEAPAAETPPAAAKPKPQAPAAKPSSTADILAAARAQGGTGGAEAAEETSKPAAAASKPAAAPKSTADILAAARAQGSEPAGSAPKAAAAGGGAPKSTSDILAAARSQGGGAAAAKPAAPKAAKPVGTPKARSTAAAAAGEHPSVQEMVRAMHEEGATATAAAPAPSARPKLPGKPPLPPKKDSISRRAALGAGLAAIVAIVMTPFAVGWILMGMLGGLWTLLGARFMMPNMVVELPSKFKVGPASDFPEGAVSTKFKASRGVWIVNSNAYNGEQLIYALISVCTHLGCTPNWLEGEQKFKCPCHGSGFYISGINFEGPAPRPLERAGIRLAEDGSLEVDKSVKFQEELGQWQDAKSFYQV